MALFLLALWVFQAAVGFVIFRSDVVIARGNELGTDRAVFETVNASSLTGFRAAIGFHQFRPAGQIMVFGQTLLGAFIALVVGGMAVVRIVGLPYTDRQLIQSAALLTFLVAPLAGAVPLLAAGESPWSAGFLSASAFANSGHAISALPAVTSWHAHLVLMPLALAGGLGVPVLLELKDLVLHRRPLSSYSRTVLAMTAGVYVVATVVLALFQTGRGWGEALAAGSVTAVNSRSAGFVFGVISGGAGATSRVTDWLVIGLMLLGAASAGTAGGLKLTTLAALFRGGRDALRGRAVNRIYGIALAWTAGYVGLVVLTFLLLLGLEPALPAERLAFLAASAAGTVGLSHDPVALTGPALFVLSGAMTLGSLLPLGVLWWAALTTRDAELAVG